MAKKNTKKEENIEVSPETATSIDKIETIVEVAGEITDVPIKRRIHNLPPLELRVYEELIYKLVIYYEKMLRLDEVEGRPVMSENRNKYTRLSVLHKDIMKVIEDKVIELEEYEWN